MKSNEENLEKLLDYAMQGLNKSHENFKRLLEDAKKLADDYAQIKAENEELKEQLKGKQ